MTEATSRLPGWRDVADALASKYEGAGVAIVPTWEREAVAAALRGARARYAAFVLAPEEVTRPVVSLLHRAVRQIDDDPYGDCLWGIVTGRDAAAARRLAEAKEPLVIKRLLATTNVGSSRFEHSYCITDWSGFPVLESSDYREPVKTEYAQDSPEVSQQGMQHLFASQLENQAPQMIVTSSHATQFNLEMPFGQGLIMPTGNRFYEVKRDRMPAFVRSVLKAAVGGDTDALLSFAREERLPEIKPDGTPRVWLAAGNCLFGDAAGCDRSMAMTALSAYSCNQLVGYTVPSWYGEGGWGTLSLFFENVAGTTLAEAFFLNNQFMISRTCEIDPKLMQVEFNDPEVNVGFQSAILSSGARLSSQNVRDAVGLVHDRDVVAFYGDPKWAAVLDEKRSSSPYTVEWHNAKEFTLKANRDVSGRCAIWFPTAETGRGSSSCDAEDAVFTNDFILFPHLQMKQGEWKTVRVR